ncbi:MAG: O-antigen ligase family protein [Rhodospirillaceae bacterium]
MAVWNTILGCAVLALIWLRPHPDAFPEALSVYAPDLLLLGLILITIATNLPRIGSRRMSTAPGILIGLLAFYPVAILALSGFHPERVKSFLIVAYLCAVSMGLLVLVDSVPTFREVMRWRVQRFAVLVVLIIALIQLFRGSSLEPAVHALWGSNRLRGLGFTAPRIYGTFYNANWFGVTMAIVIVHAVWLTMARRSGFLNYITIAGATGALIASGSRSALMAGVFGVGSSLLALTGQLRFRTVARTGLVATVLVGSLVALFATTDTFAGSSRYTEVVGALYSGDLSAIGSAQERVEAWVLYASAVSRQPVIGPGEVSAQTTAHNSYLSAAALFGVPGGVAVILMLVLITVEVSGLPRHWHLMRFGTYMVVFSAAAATAEYWFTTQVYLALVLVLLAFRLEEVAHRSKSLPLASNPVTQVPSTAPSSPAGRGGSEGHARR